MVMRARAKLSEKVTVGGEPTGDEWKELADLGFKSVVDLRLSGTDRAEAQADKAGLKFRNIPLSIQDVDADDLEHFCNSVDRMAKPTYIYCDSGDRSGLFTLLHMGIKDEKSGNEILAKARRLGYDASDPALCDLIRNYAAKEVTS